MMREKRQAMSIRKLLRTDEKKQCFVLSNLEKLIESLTLLIASAALMGRIKLNLVFNSSPQKSPLAAFYLWHPIKISFAYFVRN